MATLVTVAVPYVTDAKLTQIYILSWNHLLTNQYCGLNPSPNASILFLHFFLHVLVSVSEFRMNLM
jgi:hypothetical protein